MHIPLHIYYPVCRAVEILAWCVVVQARVTRESQACLVFDFTPHDLEFLFCLYIAFSYGTITDSKGLFGPRLGDGTAGSVPEGLFAAGGDASDDASSYSGSSASSYTSSDSRGRARSYHSLIRPLGEAAAAAFMKSQAGATAMSLNSE
jgi:hypothetical protein